VLLQTYCTDLVLLSVVDAAESAAEIMPTTVSER
jgi:hypothetical protein